MSLEFLFVDKSLRILFTISIFSMQEAQEIYQLKEKIKILLSENEKLKENIIEINQAKELYLKIFENFPALIWRSGLDMQCDYFNQTWLDFRGRTLAQELGVGWTEGIHPDDYDMCLQTYHNAFQNREPFEIEYRILTKSNEWAWIKDFGRPFFDLDNTFLGYLGSCYDITEIKQNASALKELNATKDKFLSIISHDLRNPINTVVGLSELLEKNILKNDFHSVAEFAKNINQSSKRIKNLLVNLLQWSISQGGLMEYNPTEVRITSVIREILDLTEEMLKQKEIEVELNFVENDKVIIDKEMISTVIRNFITNAIKFCYPKGKIKVGCEIKDESFVLSISDNGMGMSPEVIKSLFVIGETISLKGTNNETGSGIGLLLCKEFIEKHQGTIFVESEEGKGSTFRVQIPREEKTNYRKLVTN